MDIVTITAAKCKIAGTTPGAQWLRTKINISKPKFVVSSAWEK
jgi:hypothetical protein